MNFGYIRPVSDVSGRYLLLTQQDYDYRIAPLEKRLSIHHCSDRRAINAAIAQMSVSRARQFARDLNKNKPIPGSYTGVRGVHQFIRDQYDKGRVHAVYTGYDHYLNDRNVIARKGNERYRLVPSVCLAQDKTLQYTVFISRRHAESFLERRLECSNQDLDKAIAHFYNSMRACRSKMAVSYAPYPSSTIHAAELLASGEAVVVQTIQTLQFDSPVDRFVQSIIPQKIFNDQARQGCALDVFILHCEHYGKTRSFQLDAVNDAPNFLNQSKHVLQVVASNDRPEKIRLEYDGGCETGAENCPSVILDGGEYSSQRLASPHQFKVIPLPPRQNAGSGITGFIKKYFLPDISTLDAQTYTLRSDGCGSSAYSAEVHCFPTFECEGKVAAKINTTRGQNVSFSYDDRGRVSAINEPIEKPPFSLSGELVLKRDTQESNFSFGTEKGKEDAFSKVQDLIDGALNAIQTIEAANKAMGMSSVSMGVETGLELAGKAELKEVEKTGDVDIEASITFGAAPLVKAEFEVDILDAIIGIAGSATAAAGGMVVANILKKVRARLDKGYGSKKSLAQLQAEIYMRLKLTGQIDAKFAWAKKAGDDKLKYDEFKSEGLLGFNLIAGAAFSMRVFKVQVITAAELIAAAVTGADKPIGIMSEVAVKPGAGGDNEYSGKLEFSGMAIYLITYIEVGAGEMESISTSNAGRGGDDAGFGGSPVDKKYKNQEKTSWTWLDKKELVGWGDPQQMFE